MTEQRKNQRFELRLPFEILGSRHKERVTGETRNVSSCGVLVKADGVFPIGEPIEYLMTFPRAPGAPADVRLRCMGKVVREDDESVFAVSLERYEFLKDALSML